MKIIITSFFEKQFKKVVKDLKLEDLIEKINIESKNFIGLNEPYFKLKINSKNKAYRLIIAYDKNELVILFINIFDKKDKKYWENISWNLDKNKIIYWRNKNIEEIKSGKYSNFFI